MAYISFKSGRNYNASYLKEDLFDDYNSAKMGEWENIKIDFLFPNGNILSAKRQSVISDSQTVLFNNDIEDGLTLTVYADLNGENFGVRTGEIVVIDSSFYYEDYKENEITYTKSFDLEDYSNVLAYEIIDKELISDLKEAQKKYYGDDYGFLEDDNLTKTVSDVLLIIIFGIVPFLIALIFIALAIVNKTIYKKFFRAIYISALLAVAIFIDLAVIL